MWSNVYHAKGSRDRGYIGLIVHLAEVLKTKRFTRSRFRKTEGLQSERFSSPNIY